MTNGARAITCIGILTGLTLAACDGGSPTDRVVIEGETFSNRPNATGTWTGWVAFASLDSSELVCGGFHHGSGERVPGSFDLLDQGGTVTGGALLDDGRGGPLSGTFDGTRMHLTDGAAPHECVRVLCSSGPEHVLCRTGVEFDGVVVNRDSWQGSWSVTYTGQDGTVAWSGPFRADR